MNAPPTGKKLSSFSALSASDSLRATVQRITYKNRESGFGVLRVELERDQPELVSKDVTVVGPIPDEISSGMAVLLCGFWQEHPVYGRQFRAKSITECEPAGREAIIRYLAEGPVRGFGPVLARRIVEHLGEETLRVIDEEPERLLEVSGVGPKRLEEIKSQWEAKRNIREVLLFLQRYDIPLGLAQRIYRTYGEQTIRVLKEDPYLLARDVWGIGFPTADRIALSSGIDPNSSLRLIAGILHTMKRSVDEGHCYLPEQILLAKVSSLLGISDDEALRQALAYTLSSAELQQTKEGLYLPEILAAEQSVASFIAERLGRGQPPTKNISSALLKDTLNKRFSPTSLSSQKGKSPALISLSAQQQEALGLAARSSLVVITGGPGCGKTTLVRAIAALFRRAGLELKLAAPTGRAAQRLAEVCGIEASTIHRLLKYDPSTNNFVHNRNFPLPLDAIIVDESSMIDILLAKSLTEAIPRGARVIFVGDADQLPSVGPGLFLSDLLQIETLPRVRLSVLFRRADESLITHIAHQINSSSVPFIPEPDGQTKADAYFLPAPNTAEAAALIERLVVEQIPKKFGFSSNEITVLSPMNRGELGIIALNQRLQARLAPAESGLAQLRMGSIDFRLGDRVVQRVNNYEIHSSGVFNGDQGEIVGIDAEERLLWVRFWDGREIKYTLADLPQLDLSYALTIHRAQGSEVPVIVLALHESHSILLERQLLYTAVTRAKKLLIIVGTKRALVLATKRHRSKRRFTALPERTCSLIVGGQHN